MRIIPSFLLFLISAKIAQAGNLPPLDQACYVTYDTKSHLRVSCSGTLVAPDLVVTAAHCFKDGPGSIKDSIFVGCGFRGHLPNNNFIFVESFKAIGLRLNWEQGDTVTDFAFLKLERDSRLRPLTVSLDLEQFKKDFTSRNPIIYQDIVLRSDIECRYSGFGFDPDQKRNLFFTSDQSPSHGLKGFIGDGTLVLDGWGETIGRLRFGDSGGPLYCRSSPGSPWVLVAILSKGNTATQTHWAATTSRQFRNFFYWARDKWIAGQN